MEAVFQTSYTFSGSIFNVLLVEEHLEDAKHLEKLLLEINGFREVIVTKAVRIGEAIKLLHQEKFDLVLLDLSLPDSQGLNTIAKLKQHVPKIPIVALTASDEEEIALRSIEAGAQDYLVKGEINDRVLFRSLHYAIDRQRTELQMSLLLEATQAIGQSQDFHESLAVILRLLCTNIDWSFAEAWIPSDDGTVLEYSPGWFAEEACLEVFGRHREKLKLAPATGMAGRIWSSRQPEWIEDISVTKELVFQQYASNELRQCACKEAVTSLKTCFGVPILAGEQVVAVLVFFKQSKSPKDRSLIKLFNAVATQLSSQIQRKKAEAALLLREERLNLAISGSGLGLWDWNVSTGQVYFDSQWKKMLGYEVWEIQNSYQSWEQLLHPEDLPRVMQILNDHLEGYTELYQVEFRMRSKSGEWKWILSQGKVFKRDELGKPVRITGTHKDISDRKKAEEANLQLTRKYQEAERIAHIGSWEFDVLRGTITWSDELFRIYGKKPSKALSFNELVKQIHPEDIEAFLEVVERAMTEGTSYQIDHRIIRPNGEIRYINSKGQAVRTKSGYVLRLLGTAIDITDRFLAEAALRESEQRFRAIFEQAAIGIAQVSPDGKFLKVNPGLCKIVGYSEAELLLREVRDITHPEDLDAEQSYSQKLLAGEIQSYSMEKRFIRKDGEFVWTNLAVSLVRQTSGEIKYAIGVIEDISDRKQAEAALQQQFLRQRLMRGILDRIRRSLNLEEILKTAVQEVRQFLSTDRTIIYRFKPDRGGVAVVESVGEEWMPILGLDIADNCFPEKFIHLYQQGRIRAIEDIYNAGLNECHIDSLTRFQVKANLVVPILQGENLWGLLIAHHCSGSREWLETEIDCLKQLSLQLAIAIQQSILFEQAKIEIAERQRVELALRESQAQLQANNQQLEVALKDLQQTQAKLIQNEKMVSLGQMVGGIAHEINNPVNFIFGNLNYVSQYVGDLLELVELYQQNYSKPIGKISKQIEEIDLEFISQDLPKLLNSMKVGTQRIENIVKSLRNFSRLDEAEMKTVDIHEGIESTLMLLQYRLKCQGKFPPIQLVKDYSKLPLVECYPGQLNQVIMNLLTNAIDAIASRFANEALEEQDNKRTAEAIADNPSIISISTNLSTIGQVAISIADNGPGIPESIRKKLFDPFFTTKPVGKGTGLGLSIAHSIVVERHGGQITCISTPGEGAEFIIEIPLRQRKLMALTRSPQLENQNHLLSEEFL